MRPIFGLDLFDCIVWGTMLEPPAPLIKVRVVIGLGLGLGLELGFRLGLGQRLLIPNRPD